MKRLYARLRHSLSARLMLLFVVTGLLIGFLLSGTLRLATRHYFVEVIRPHLVQYLDYLQQDIGAPPSIDRAQALTQRVAVAVTIRGPTVNWSSTPALLPLEDIHFRTYTWQGRPLAVADHDDTVILKTQAGDHAVYYAIQSRIGHRHGFWVGLLSLAAMLAVLYGCYWAIHRLFQPVQAIRLGVERIGAGDLGYRIHTRRRDELGELTASINAMANDIEKMLDAKRQLLLAISHELRSPLTRARVSAELVDDPKLSQAISAELREMETLLAELLETERLNTRHRTLSKTPVAINQLVREVVAESFPDQPFTINLSTDDPYVLVDSARLKLLVKNLLDNASRYNTGDAPPWITIAVSECGLGIEVGDHGPGVAPEHLPHLTEPLYRADPSRQRKTGGYGLGLYLCRRVAEAHGGRLTIASVPGEGTTVRVMIPLADASPLTV